MRACVALALMMLVAARSFAAGFDPPDENQVRKVIFATLAMDPAKLEKSTGPWTCRVFGTSFSGRGETMLRAHDVAGFKCIRHKCLHFGEETVSAITDDPDITAIFRSLGLDEEVIRRIQEKARSGETLNRDTCRRTDRTGALARIMVYDACFGTASDCEEDSGCNAR